jgi:hypothetical protein
MIRPLVITIVSAIYLIASLEAQQPGTYNNVLSYFKEHPLIDKNGAPTETFQNVLKKVSTMSPPGGARPAAIPPITPFRPNGYSPNYAQYQNYAQAQYRQAQARAAAMLPPIPANTPPQAPPPSTPPQPSQPAPEPAPQPESSPEPQAAPAPQPEPQAAPEEPKEEPAAPEPQANQEEAKSSEPAPEPAQEPAQEPQVANEEEPAWSPQGATDGQPAQETEQAQPAAEEGANLEAAPAQGEEQHQPEEASVTPAGDNAGSETLNITTEASDLGIPPASANMNNMTDTLSSNSSMLNNVTNGMMGSSVGIGGSTYTYSSIDMMAPSNSPQSPASAPTTYVPPMASAATLNTRFDDLLYLSLLLFNVMAFIMA